MQGQDILMDDFNKGAYAMVVVQNMDTKSTDRLIKKVENVDQMFHLRLIHQNSESISRMTAQIQLYLQYSSIIQLQVMIL